MKRLLIVLFGLGQCLILNAQAPCPNVPPVTCAGQTYHTVQIGTQCWLRENLNIGTMIDSTKDQTNNGIIEKYCYNGSPDSCTKYGGLYQWAEAVQYQNGATNTSLPNPAFSGNVQGICPSGWHIPSKAEYETLSTTVNYNGNALKAVGQGLAQYRGAGTNTSGFSALLAGMSWIANSTFESLGSITYFWSSTEGITSFAYIMCLSDDVGDVGWHYGYLRNGFSVRCLKD
jgi:uncharacterized protein (TIGR02145 family)